MTILKPFPFGPPWSVLQREYTAYKTKVKKEFTRDEQCKWIWDLRGNCWADVPSLAANVTQRLFHRFFIFIQTCHFERRDFTSSCGAPCVCKDSSLSNRNQHDSVSLVHFPSFQLLSDPTSTNWIRWQSRSQVPLSLNLKYCPNYCCCRLFCASNWNLSGQ